MTVPNLVLAERVLRRMASAAQTHLQDETGEAMVGLVTGGATSAVPTLYVLDTIAPDDSAVRQRTTFQQGDARQDELIWWLQENWRVSRERKGGIIRKLSAPNRFDVPLRYLGDWHKQPGYMIQPSGGDLNTALDWILDSDNEMDFLLAPIVTIGHPSTVQNISPMANFVMMPLGDGEALRVDFWYIDRRTQLFQPIAPVLYPDDQLPMLAPYPWHLQDDARLRAEIRLFERAGLFHAISFWNADGEPPLEVCFLTGRVGADHLLLLITPHDYPKSPPQVRSAPFIPMTASDDLYRVFDQAFRRSQPVALTLDWSPALYLADVIEQAEAIIRPGSAAPVSTRLSGLAAAPPTEAASKDAAPPADSTASVSETGPS